MGRGHTSRRGWGAGRSSAGTKEGGHFDGFLAGCDAVSGL